VCTRIDEALKEDIDEPPPTFSPNELPFDSEEDEEDPALHSDDSDTDENDSTTSEKVSSTLQYSTRIHERVFNDLVNEGFLDDLEEDQLQSHDRCDFFHCVSSYAATRSARVEENPFVKEFLQFERSLAKVIVGNLNAHVLEALEELISKQTLLIEIVLQTKFSLAKKATAAEQQLQFIVKTEERVYTQLRDVVANSRLLKLEKLIRDEKAASLLSIPQEAGEKATVKVDTSSRNDQNKAANQVCEFVCDRFNGNFKKRVRDHIPVLNIGETIERCAKAMQAQVDQSLEAVRLVSRLMQAAYTSVTKVANVKQGLPLKRRIQGLFNSLMHKEPAECFTKSWKEDVARHCIKSLKAKEIAEEYCEEVEKTLEKSHEEFQLSIDELRAAKQSIVKEARGQQRQVRIRDGYELAALFLDSKSFLDSLRHGVPQKGEEIGAGPTSIVHKCLKGAWGQIADVVLKVRKPWPPRASEPRSREVWPASLYFSVECLDHKNIQKAIGFVVPPEAPRDEIWVLEESCRCSLEDVLQGTTRLDSIPWLQIGMNAVDGLLHLFCQGIPHHNIKPSNVLLSAGSLEAKLCDMGMHDIAYMKQNTVTRAVYFVAPELAESETEGVATTDVYSIGILLWYLIKGYSVVKEPGKAVPDPSKFGSYENAPATEFFKMVSDPSVLLRPELDEWGSHGHRLSNAADLMKRCWQHNSSERLDRRSLKDELQKVK
jgi:serine/threonine protein kinase